jgi:hypothetical protein
MDGEQRHDLEENDLAESVMTVVQKLRPHLWTAATAALALVGGMAAWSLITAQQAASRSRSWDACMAALAERNPERLGDVIRQYPGSPAAQWSQLLLADSAIAEGSQQLFADRNRGRERLEAAVGIYSTLLGERPQGLIAERAVFGLAKAREGLGQLEEARRGYEALVAEYPASAVRGIAANRIAALSSDATRQWYDWFAAQNVAVPAAAAGDQAAPPTSNAQPATPAAAAPPAAAPGSSEPAGAAAGTGGK